ncbi:MAG: hypothetical protein IJ428_03390 [Clostridia bacterium]|nr:hypothetical protein [Clostridia bacterium]
MKTVRAFSRLLAVTLVTALAIPLANTVVIRSLGIYFAADPLTYGYTVTDALGYIYNFINIISTFSVSACLAYSVVTRKARLAVILTAALSLAVVYASGIICEIAVDSRVLAASDIIENVSNLAVELIRYGAVMLVAWFTERHAAKKGITHELELLSFHGTLSLSAIFTTLCVSLMILASLGVETVMLVLTYGAPESFSEIMELVMPYITMLIYSILGYFACFAAMRVIEKPKQAARELRK